ncbi:hypothetical protein CLF_106686 [Clonorchis sinensis]|uniref:Uncharacterized protein n=1 Tax=Clonorchis sinensis TaxID=79923 RepID=G7YFI5_CLOSI|nr:hypothetical protein CLF_106686 [Clonorchis sinensis]
MLERGFNGTGTICVAQNNESVAICPVKARQQPWTNSTEITVGDIWLVDVIDEVSSETVREFEGWSSGEFAWMINDAKTRIGNHGIDEKLYEISRVTESLRQVCYLLKQKRVSFFSVEDSTPDTLK